MHVSRSLRNCLALSRGLGCGDMRVPTDKAILALHEQHAPTPEALEAVYTHCVIVCGIAEQLHARSGREASLDLVRAGCLLHDVGVYRLHDGAGRLDHAKLHTPRGTRARTPCGGRVFRGDLPVRLAPHGRGPEPGRRAPAGAPAAALRLPRRDARGGPSYVQLHRLLSDYADQLSRRIDAGWPGTAAEP